MVREQYGEAIVHEVLIKCNLKNMSFSSHERYSERIVPDVLQVGNELFIPYMCLSVQATCEITGDSAETVGVWAGLFNSTAY
jgi:hypothetical protein